MGEVSFPTGVFLKLPSEVCCLLHPGALDSLVHKSLHSKKSSVCTTREEWGGPSSKRPNWGRHTNMKLLVAFLLLLVTRVSAGQLVTKSPCYSNTSSSFSPLRLNTVYHRDFEQPASSLCWLPYRSLASILHTCISFLLLPLPFFVTYTWFNAGSQETIVIFFPQLFPFPSVLTIKKKKISLLYVVYYWEQFSDGVTTVVSSSHHEQQSQLLFFTIVVNFDIVRI